MRGLIKLSGIDRDATAFPKEFSVHFLISMIPRTTMLRIVIRTIITNTKFYDL